MKWNWIILDNPSSEEIKHRRSKELYSWLVTLKLPSWCVLRRQDKLGLKKRKSVLQWGYKVRFVALVCHVKSLTWFQASFQRTHMLAATSTHWPQSVTFRTNVNKLTWNAHIVTHSPDTFFCHPAASALLAPPCDLGSRSLGHLRRHFFGWSVVH